MNPLQPIIVGAWDGNHLWLQWNDAAPETGYQVRVRYLPPGISAWGKWIAVAGPGAFLRCWLKIPTHKTGWRAQAEAARFGAGEEEFEPAREGLFTKSRCRFEVVNNSAAHKVTFDAHEAFHCVVEGEPASYRLTAAVEIAPQSAQIAEVESLQSSGFNQLDRENDFLVKPAFDCVVRNIEPSQFDLELTGASETRIAARAPDGPFTATFGRLLR